jgi:hypothetical protein
MSMRAIRTPFKFNHKDFDARQLARMHVGADKLLNATLALQARQHTVLSPLLPKTGGFKLWDHYPQDEVTDSKHASQYYYHAHRTSKLEHGHFHLFSLTHANGQVRAKTDVWREDEAPSHLIAISMSPEGFPIKVFCPNQWVTKGYWQPADTVLSQLDRFVVSGPARWSQISRWLTGFVMLFRPQIAAALYARDVRVQLLRQRRQWRTFWADESIDVINYIPINLHQQIAWLDDDQFAQTKPN